MYRFLVHQILKWRAGVKCDGRSDVRVARGGQKITGGWTIVARVVVPSILTNAEKSGLHNMKQSGNFEIFQETAYEAWSQSYATVRVTPRSMNSMSV